MDSVCQELVLHRQSFEPTASEEMLFDEDDARVCDFLNARCDVKCKGDAAREEQSRMLLTFHAFGKPKWGRGFY